MAPEFFNPEGIAPSPVNLYNHVVKVGNTVYIAGQVSRGLDGNTIHKGDAAAQIRVVWANLERAIQAAGGTLKDIVKTTTYVVGQKTWRRSDPFAWNYSLKKDDPPAPPSWLPVWPTPTCSSRWRR